MLESRGEEIKTTIASGHASDDQLLEEIYGVGSLGGHLQTCESCEGRLGQLRSSRQLREQQFDPAQDLSADLLAQQRRNIYSQVERRSGWRTLFPVRYLASATAGLVLLIGGLTVFESSQHSAGPHPTRTVASSQVSDSELADDVSSLADTVEPGSTDPLQALFEE